MGKVNLFWALVWTLIAAVCVAAIFLPSMAYVAIAIAAVFSVTFWREYHRTRKY